MSQNNDDNMSDQEYAEMEQRLREQSAAQVMVIPPMDIENARESLGYLVGLVQYDQYPEIILTRNGKPAARIVPIGEDSPTDLRDRGAGNA